MEDLWITDFLSIPASEFEVTYSRSSGPGGQNVNKVNSKVSVHWQLSTNLSLPEPVRIRLRQLAGSRLNSDGSILVVSQEHRDQVGNQRECMTKIRELILLAMRPPKPRRPTQPTRSSQRRRLADKKSTSDKKSMRQKPNWD